MHRTILIQVESSRLQDVMDNISAENKGYLIGQNIGEEMMQGIIKF